MYIMLIDTETSHFLSLTKKKAVAYFKTQYRIINTTNKISLNFY